VDQWGSRLSIKVQRAGNFSGSGYASDGTAIRLSGQLSAGSSYGQVQIPGLGMTMTTELLWDGGCHVDYVTYTPTGAVNASGRFHANHSPGAPCP
jgi:hypothetical protein